MEGSDLELTHSPNKYSLFHGEPRSYSELPNISQPSDSDGDVVSGLVFPKEIGNAVMFLSPFPRKNMEKLGEHLLPAGLDERL